MERKILVAYASKYGATREIAEKIAGVLGGAGFQADVLPAGRDLDPSTYSAVVLGAALYIGKWHKDAEAFVKTQEESLATRPVWVFSSGPSGEGDPLELVEGQRLPANMQPILDRIRPQEATVFHGNIDPGKIHFMEKWAVQNVVKKPMGDYRDWGMITAWAAKIAAGLAQLEPVQ